MSGNRALFCSPVLPEFDRESGSRRIYNLIEFLREAKWAVTFIAENGNSSDSRRYVNILQQLGVETYIGYSDELLERVLSPGDIDVAIFAFWNTAEKCINHVRRCSPNTRIIVDSIDLHFVREARQIIKDIAIAHTKESTDGSVLELSQGRSSVPFGQGSPVLTWTTGGGSQGAVCVSVNGESENLVACEESGSVEIDWFDNTKSYEFRLYDGIKCGNLLSSLVVGEKSRFHGLDSEYAMRMIRELNTYASADAVLTVSQKEANLVSDFVGEITKSYTVHDCEALSLSPIPFDERKGILFLGNFRHPPNVEAAEYLCKEIIPLIDPKFLLHNPIYIVGNALNDRIRGFADHLDCDVRMIGWVPSVIPYFESARVSVAPLLYGAGTKRKLLQSLMLGVPIISTSIGVEGLNLITGKNVLVADGATAFAEAIVTLLGNNILWKKLVKEGASYINEHYGRETTRKIFSQVLNNVLADSTKTKILSINCNEQQESEIKANYYSRLIDQIRRCVTSSLPAKSTIIVVSKGDEQILHMGSMRCWHFPRHKDGTYTGYYPKDSDDAVNQLESLVAQGGEFLLFPESAFWWLDHYAMFKRYLKSNYQEIATDGRICKIFQLSKKTKLSSICYVE